MLSGTQEVFATVLDGWSDSNTCLLSSLPAQYTLSLYVLQHIMWLCMKGVTGHYSFISHRSPSLSTSAPPLTVDNVLTAVQGEQWRTLGKMFLPDDYDDDADELFYPKLDKIAQQHQSNDDRLHAVVNTWVLGEGVDREPSWRCLIWELDHHNMAGVADTIRHYAEHVLGKSCDSISVSTFLYNVII